jgi:hypothetical protein
VKFVLGPFGLYEVNRTRPFESLIPIDRPMGALFAALAVFGLYAGVLFDIYRVMLRLVRGPSPSRARRIVLGGVIASIVLAGGLGSIVLVVLATVASSSALYLEFVFSSGASLLVALSLAGATGLCAMTFASTAERARIVGDASVIVTIFWIALAFLALYHVLWVVYILVLTSIWPLKVVIPK